MPGKRKHSAKPEWQKETVRERVSALFAHAAEEFRSHPERSHRYVAMAVKLCMRYNMNMPGEFRKRFCKSCKSYLVPGENSRVRTSPSQKAVIMTCLECGTISRHPYRKEKSKAKDREKK